MSFNKYFIPDPIDLASAVQQNGVRNTVNRKIDAIVGNPTSVEIFDFMYNSVKADIPEPEIMEKLILNYPEYFNAQSN